MQSLFCALRRSLLLLGYIAAACLNADDRIIIEAKLNDQPLKLAFDTGAGDLVIFRNVAERLGLQIVPPPSDAQKKPGQVFISHTEPVKWELFGQITPDLRVGVLDHPRAIQPDVDGMLGWPNIRNNIWNFSASALQLNTVDAIPPEVAKWLMLQEINDPQLLCLALPYAQSAPSVCFGIDTGADSGVKLSAEAWGKWRKAHPKTPVTLNAYIGPGIGLVIAEIAWTDEIDLGGLILRGVSVTSMDAKDILLYPRGTIAVLGLAAMKRIDMVIDGKNGVAYAHPLDTPPQPSTHNRLGAVFVPANVESATDLVAHVAKNSPAARAGVKDADILLKIDGLDVTPWRTQPGILPLSRFWTQDPGTKLHLILQRNGKTFTADVVLRDILGPASK